jgi:hypothetical protein
LNWQPALGPLKNEQLQIQAYRTNGRCSNNDSKCKPIVGIGGGPISANRRCQRIARVFRGNCPTGSRGCAPQGLFLVAVMRHWPPSAEATFRLIGFVQNCRQMLRTSFEILPVCEETNLLVCLLRNARKRESSRRRRSSSLADVNKQGAGENTPAWAHRSLSA